MTSRERIFTALDHREPDRVPIHADFTPEAAEKLSAHLKLRDATAEAYSGKVSELPLVMGHDLLVAWHGIATSYYASSDEEYTCEWGIGWKWVDIPGGRYTEIARRPLADERALDSWSCPDAADDRRYDAVRRLIAEHGSTHAIVGGMPCTFFEAAWYLRGYEEFLTDLMVNKDFAHALLDKLFGFQLVTGTKIAGRGRTSSGWATISAPSIRSSCPPKSGGSFSNHATPPHRRTQEGETRCEDRLPLRRQHRGDPSRVYRGRVDILNAVQPKSMDTAHLKRRFGDRLSFWGTVDIQEVMPFGTPAQVEEEVRLRMRAAGKNGGLIVGPSHNFQPDVPLENILAFYDAAKTYGKYPLG